MKIVLVPLAVAILALSAWVIVQTSTDYLRGERPLIFGESYI
jgi:hypothetical protein